MRDRRVCLRCSSESSRDSEVVEKAKRGNAMDRPLCNFFTAVNFHHKMVNTEAEFGRCIVGCGDGYEMLSRERIKCFLWTIIVGDVFGALKGSRSRGAFSTGDCHDAW